MLNGVDVDNTARDQYLRLQEEAKNSRENGLKDKILEMLDIFANEFTQLLAISIKLKEDNVELYKSFGIIIENFIEKLNDVGILTIGKIGEETEFDPIKHLLLSSAGPIGLVSPGTKVVITMP